MSANNSHWLLDRPDSRSPGAASRLRPLPQAGEQHPPWLRSPTIWTAPGADTTRDLALSIDVGTGSARAALVDGGGRILAIAAEEHEQIVPQFGWSEQRPADWWAGVVQSVRTVLDQVEGASGRIAAICACGQMHRHGAGRRHRRPDPRHRPLVERQAHARPRRGVRARPSARNLPGRERQPADAGLAGLQAGLDPRPRPRGGIAGRRR